MLLLLLSGLLVVCAWQGWGLAGVLLEGGSGAGGGERVGTLQAEVKKHNQARHFSLSHTGWLLFQVASSILFLTLD